MKIVYYLIFGFWYVLSLLPLRLLYVVSDLLYYPLYHIIRYRRKVVRKNLTSSFPEKELTEIVRIEKQFYAFFCDYVVETIRQFSMPVEEMRRRMTFSGVEEMMDTMEKEQHQFCFVYLGHYCNWEWIASLPFWMPKDMVCGQIYHPLYNQAFDKLFLRLRNQYGGTCIPMKETLRRIIELKRSGKRVAIGFISDQAPKWNSIHHFTTFLHQDTPVFTGTEKIGRQVGATIYFADVTRPRRGYYHCHLYKLTDKVENQPEFRTTDMYMEHLEQMIRRAPQYWLWSHNRWKRTKEEWLQRMHASAHTHK